MNEESFNKQTIFHGFPKSNSGPLSFERLSENGPVLKSHLYSNLSSCSGESAQRWKFSTAGLAFLLKRKKKKGKKNTEVFSFCDTASSNKNKHIQRQGSLT